MRSDDMPCGSSVASAAPVAAPARARSAGRAALALAVLAAPLALAACSGFSKPPPSQRGPTRPGTEDRFPGDISGQRFGATS